jgi:hypothetical protein
LSEGRPGVIIGYSKIKPNEPVEKVFWIVQILVGHKTDILFSIFKIEHLIEMDGCETIKVPRQR